MALRPTGNAWYAERQREQRATGVVARGLGRIDAALYLGVTVRVFDEMVKKGLMPPPKLIPGSHAQIWDRVALDLFFAALPEAVAEHEGRSPSQ